MLRHLGFGLLTFALVVGVIGTSEQPAWATSDEATSVKVGTDVFLAGMYVEAGLKENGSFGSAGTAPGGFHPQGVTGIGFVAVRDTAQPSWSAASAAGLVDGDFFLPGTPVEAWALKVGSVVGNNTDVDTDIPGFWLPVTDATGTSGNNTVRWASTATWEGLNIVKTYSVPQAGQRVDVEVMLTNATTSEMTNIYYGRGLDPDDAQLPVPAMYQSTNTIVSQISEGGSSSRVSAAFTRGSQISLDSTDPRSRVARIFSGFSGDFDPASVWAATAPLFIGTVGSSATGDAGINLAIKIDSLGAGQSTTFTLSYLLAPTVDAVGGAGAELPAGPRIALDFRGLAGQPSEGAVVGVSGLNIPDGSVATVSLCAPEVKLFDQVPNTRAFERTVALPAGLAPGSSTVVYRVVLPSGEVLALHVVVGVGAGGVITSVSQNVVGLPSAGACGDISALADTGVRSSSVPWWAIITIFGGLALIIYSRRLVTRSGAGTSRSH
ncbi:unannotated protein [freshwater metagenome]|uniref:Unannotated protein n=1 Tax=freshwater metagenome TaxID=449393 RepID=A0A6J6E575_9ZZZZ|nr:hypothetical protein [Actinomycetota bacterium]